MQAALALALLWGASACDSDDDGAPAPPPVDNLFSTFVIEQFAVSTGAATTSEPAAVNGVEFVFDEDPGAFDALLE